MAHRPASEEKENNCQSVRMATRGGQNTAVLVLWRLGGGDI